MHGVPDLLLRLPGSWCRTPRCRLWNLLIPSIATRNAAAEVGTALLTKTSSRLHQTRRRVQSRSVLSIKQETSWR